MRPFSFESPKTLSEALEIIGNSNGDSKLLAGGSDLIDQLRNGRKHASVVIDIKNIPEMKRLEYVEGEGLHVGAGVSCTDTANYEPTAKYFPSVRESCLLIGSTQIQNRASMAGNVCNAAPSGDTIPSLITYDTRALIAGSKGTREVNLTDFLLGPGKTTLETDELMVELIIPTPAVNSDGHYLRFIPREEMDIAVAGAASMIAVDPDTMRCSKVRICLASVAPTPVRASKAEEVLQDQLVTDELIHHAATLAPLAANPINDIRGTIEYRKELCRVLTYRTLSKCLSTLKA